jgi:hypothetical protein
MGHQTRMAWLHTKRYLKIGWRLIWAVPLVLAFSIVMISALIGWGPYTALSIYREFR